MRAARIIQSVIGVCLVTAILPSTAAAQAAPSAAPASGSGVMIGVVAGASSVQNVGGLAGAEIGYRVNDRVQIFGEGVWMQDLVSRARESAITGFASYLSSTQGKTATASLTVPTVYAGGGIRVFLTTGGGLRPYVAAGAGMANMVSKPSFALNGSDITTSLPTYGVTLGADLTGDVSKLGITGGFGVQADKTKFVIDAGVRLISIQTDGQKTNALRGHVGLLFKF